MALPTVQEILEDLYAYRDFETRNDLARAIKFRDAASGYLLLTPEQQKDEHSEITFNVDEVRRQMERANQFIAAKDSRRTRSRSFAVGDGFRG